MGTPGTLTPTLLVNHLDGLLVGLLAEEASPLALHMASTLLTLFWGAGLGDTAMLYLRLLLWTPALALLPRVRRLEFG